MYAKPVKTRSTINAFVTTTLAQLSSRHAGGIEMATKAKKTTKLHRGKTLEAQKPLKVSQGNISISKHVDTATPK